MIDNQELGVPKIIICSGAKIAGEMGLKWSKWAKILEIFFGPSYMTGDRPPVPLFHTMESTVDSKHNNKYDK